MAEILDDRDGWTAAFEQGWLAHYRQTGETDFSRYPHVRNEPIAPRPGLDLSRSRLLLISSAGGYDPDTQDPFDAADPVGDYTWRTLPQSAPLDTLRFAHEHYDHEARRQDPGVLLPHALLDERVQDGRIGELAPVWVSFMGYQPDLRRVVDHLIPGIVQVALRQHAEAALLVPS